MGDDLDMLMDLGFIVWMDRETILDEITKIEDERRRDEPGRSYIVVSMVRDPRYA